MNLTYILILVNFFDFSKGVGDSLLFIFFFFNLYWHSYIVYFVCDSASEFGAMGSTSFLGFSYPNLLLVFLNLLFLGTSLFILFFNLYWYSYIIYFVCDSASEFGAVGSTSFLGFSSSILILVNFFNFFRGGGGG